MLALVAHPLVFALLLLVAHFWPTAPRKPKPQPISLRHIDANQWAANRGGGRPATDSPAPLHPHGQVVDVAEGNHQRAPDAKYLAESDNRVKHETRAREQTNKYSVAAPKNAPDPTVMPAAKGRAGGRAPEPVSLASQVDRFAQLNGLLPRTSEILQQMAQGKSDNNVDSNDQNGRENSEGQSERGADARAAEAGGGAPNDNLQNVDPGEGTYLNTREWKYAAFFNRVKQAVSGHWDPNGKVKSKDPRGEAVRYGDKVTVLHVVLRPDGSIAEVYVEKSCGLDWLDQEAVNAFERAQPFANPPPGLVENGYIQFSFGFSLINEGIGTQFRLPIPRH